MTDDPKRTPNTPFRPVGTYRGTEPVVTKPVARVDPESPEYGPLILDMLSKVQGSMTGIVGRLDGVEKAVADLTEWRKTGRHAPVVMPADGPQATTSGEVRRISQSDIAQNKAITGLSENQVALSDKVDVLGRGLDEAKKSIAAVADTQKAQSLTLTDQNSDLDTIKKDVGGFMARNPALSAALIAFVTTMLTWGTAYLKAKGLQ